MDVGDQILLAGLFVVLGAGLAGAVLAYTLFFMGDKG